VVSLLQVFVSKLRLHFCSVLATCLAHPILGMITVIRRGADKSLAFPIILFAA
jgi:hypothetical protein